MSDREILLLGASDDGALRDQIAELKASDWRPPGASDTAARNRAVAAEPNAVRAAVIAADPSELSERLERLESWVDAGEIPGEGLRTGRGVVLGRVHPSPRIGFLFPGQGAPVLSDPGLLADWFPEVAAVYERARDLEVSGDVPAELVQLSTVAASVAGLRALDVLGVEADFAIGHSVGELTALYWAGALSEEAVLEIARERGVAMTEHALADGAMVTIEADEEAFKGVVEGVEVSVACFNSPRHRVVSGRLKAVDAVVARAGETEGAQATRLRVVGAFHSPLMREAVPVFERYLAQQGFGVLGKPIYSTVSGTGLDADADLRALLVRQISEPVRFLDAVQEAAAGTQLLLEVGPGRMLSGLASESVNVPVVPLRVGHASSQPFLTAVAAAFAVGAAIRPARLSQAAAPGEGASDAPGSSP